MKPFVSGKNLLASNPGKVTRSGLRVLVAHARSGVDWGDGEDPGLEREVRAACRWIDGLLSAESTPKKEGS